MYICDNKNKLCVCVCIFCSLQYSAPSNSTDIEHLNCWPNMNSTQILCILFYPLFVVSTICHLLLSYISCFIDLLRRSHNMCTFCCVRIKKSKAAGAINFGNIAKMGLVTRFILPVFGNGSVYTKVRFDTSFFASHSKRCIAMFVSCVHTRFVISRYFIFLKKYLREKTHFITVGLWSWERSWKLYKDNETEERLLPIWIGGKNINAKTNNKNKTKLATIETEIKNSNANPKRKRYENTCLWQHYADSAVGLTPFPFQ